MKIAVSIGDLNGVGIELALRSHETIKHLCQPLYMIDRFMLEQAAALLNLSIPADFKTYDIEGEDFTITPSQVTKESGAYAYASFLAGITLAQNHEIDAITTLPIHKKAWELAGIPYKGHTDALAEIFEREAIMMIGTPKLFTALFTHHIPLKEVPSKIQLEPLTEFLITLYHEIKEEKIGVLGLNPHAGDNGLLGNEENIIQSAILAANNQLLEDIFVGPLVPDTAFTPHIRKHIHYYVCMYHDQGLIPVKTLYFEEGINVSLNLPVIRTSVDHGTAYDKAYKAQPVSNLSYLNAIKEAVRLIEKKRCLKI
jgi:4-hydroxythreonine-4-phosphate dehydrogenase